MSELKVILATPHLKMKNACDGAIEVYLKSEADKVITELKKACNDKDDWCLHTLKELRHQKYKRCIAMAKLCAKNVDHLNSEGYIYEKEGHAKELADCITGTEFYDKWYHRWLELAQKFKEAK